MEKNVLPIKSGSNFFVFACGYFLSCLLRAITATLSPLLSSEFNLLAGDLGLLAEDILSYLDANTTRVFT